MNAAGVALYAYLRRDWSIARSYRLGFALQLIGGLVALYVIFQVSKLVEPKGFHAKANLDTTYFAWIVVGLGIARLVDSAIASPGVRVRSEQSTGTLEAVLATPISPGLALLAGSAYDVARAALQGVILIGIAAIGFGMQLDISAVSFLATIAAAIAIVLSMLALGVLLAAVTLVAKQIPNVPALLSGVLLIVSGMWFPVGLAPHWLAELGRISPVYWALEVARQGLLGSHVRTDLLGALVVAAAVSLPLSVVIYHQVVRHVRRSGTVGLY